jgi:hypothetical protein
MQIVTIPQKFEVDGQTFDSMAAAQAYINSNADRMRLAAFVANLKAGGQQRISKAVTEAVAAFIEFEKVKETPNESPDTTAETIAGTDSGTSTEPGKSSAGDARTDSSSTKSSEEEEPLDALSVDEDDSHATNDDLNAEAESSDKSKHVDGPDEDDDEDPLAGLDLGDE